MEFKDILKKLRKEYSLSQEELAKRVNTSRSSIGNYENGENFPSTDILLKLADTFNCTVDHLLGKEDKLQELKESLFLIPIVGKIPAGEPLLAEDNIVAYLPIDPSMYGLSNPDNLFFLQVIGDSMNNVIPDGSYVLIKKQDYAETGDVVAAIINGDNEATLKRFKQLDDMFVLLEPDSTNPEHIQRVINLKDTDFKIVGKVIGDFKKWN